jgi:hypothetical protein
MNNNEPETIPATVRPLARSAVAGLACLLAASWVSPAAANVVTEWNALAWSCPPARPGPGSVFDVGVLAQAAVHDAVQAIEKRYEPYLSTPPATGSESKAAAAAAAAYRVLSDDRVCQNSFQPTLDAAFAPYSGNSAEIVIGNAAGDALLGEYRPIGSATHTPGTGVGQWQPTPPGNASMAFVYLATTEPFLMTSPSQFRPGPPPALTSVQYAQDFNEVKAVGSALAHPAAGACPAPGDTDMARFWAGNFALQFNQAMRDIAIDRQLGLGDTARLLALANLAASDALIAVWDSKTFYNFWRPITAIRSTEDDGNAATTGDGSWTPFISSAHFPAGSQNPAYPDYVSGANGVTGAFTTVMRLFFKTDSVPFEIYRTPGTVAICTNPRLYRKISEAAEEVVEARIVLGIHFRFADTEARALGTTIASHTFNNALRPKHPGWNNRPLDE